MSNVVLTHKKPLKHELANDLSDVSISSPQDNNVLTYESATNSWKNKSGGGSGDMTKAAYATASATKVDTALNAEKLEGLTKAQVQDHDPKIHTHTATIKTVLMLGVEGTLTVGINKTFELIAPSSLTITKVKIHVKTAPTSATLIVDVNKAGTTIFTNQANRPTIAIGNTDADSGVPDVTALAENDKLRVDVDKVGSTITGYDLTVEIVCNQGVVFS